jgi:GT2 family glycosyltransferase
MPARIVAVVVLYQRDLSQSPTFISICGQRGLPTERVLVVVYDNTPKTLGLTIPEGWLYCPDPSNGGVSRAYNFALDQARSQGCEWLLMLDQDTALQPDFFENLFAILDGSAIAADVAAVLPRVFSGEQQISPVLPAILRSKPFLRAEGATREWVMSINSASTVRVEFLQSVGGFTSEFWLDFLDHWLFLKIHRSGRSVYVTDLSVQHDLSIANFGESMTRGRYQNILSAESYFTNTYLPLAWRLAMPWRLLARAAKHLFITSDWAYSGMMAREALRQVWSILGVQPKRKPLSKGDVS